MKIAVVINAHDHTDVVTDTIFAVQRYVSKDILVVIDGCSWNAWGKDVELPACKMEGFRHGWAKGPYRNVTLGLMSAAKLWPNMDWYLYMEYDVLFASDAFKSHLKEHGDNGAWCVGIDDRTADMKFPLLEAMLKTQFDCSKYLLGCCVFHNGEFVRRLISDNVLEKLLYLTNDFPRDFFPGYEEQGGYDFSEHLFPTLAHHYGGNVIGLSRWRDSPGIWSGDFRHYPVRFRPELDSETENFAEASIMHPIKTYHHAIRQQQRVRRRRFG